jgi:hypothetical protein
MPLSVLVGCGLQAGPATASAARSEEMMPRESLILRELSNTRATTTNPPRFA